MKPVTALPIPALAATLGLVLLAGSLQASTIYSETFSNGSVGTPSALNGSTPDITTGAATWTASNWAENGSTATIATTPEDALNDDSAFLPFTPVAGNVYTLSATMTVPTGGEPTGWVALGFAQTTTTGSFWKNNTAPWLLWRPGDATNANVTVGAPVGTLPAATAVVTDGNGDATIEFNLGTSKDKSFVRAG